MPASQSLPETGHPKCPTCHVAMWLVASAKEPLRLENGHLLFRCPICRTGAVIPEVCRGVSD